MEESGDQSGSSSYVTGNLEENESDFQEPVHWEEEEDEEDDLDLEIIDLDDLDDEN